jgi:hypothetical protein
MKRLEVKCEVITFPEKKVKIPVKHRGKFVILVDGDVVSYGETKEEAVKNYRGDEDFRCVYLKTDEEMMELYKKAASNSFGLKD